MFKRQPNTQDIAWFLDLNSKRQLDLDPPYQRRSVWTPKDRSYFLDTILRNFPTGPIFLHKTRGGAGRSIFHVIDGKQRLETIIMFSEDKIRAPKDFGDAHVDNQRFSALPQEAQNSFWDYVLTVEMVDASEGAVVNSIFDRLNRNSRSLTRQELRHARFEGEFIAKLEAEADDPFWATVGISTRTRARRMKDVEFVAELWLLTAHGVMATTADRLDEYFAEYDSEIPDYEQIKTRFEEAKSHVERIADHFDLSTSRYRNFADFYGLFGAVLLLGESDLDAAVVAPKLVRLSDDIELAQNTVQLDQTVSDSEEVGQVENNNRKEVPADAVAYVQAIRGASNDLKERRERIAILPQRLFEIDIALEP